MKTIAICTMTFTVFTLAAFGQGSQAIAKQRAKNLANQNNANQATTPAAPAAPAPLPTPIVPPPTPPKPNQHQQNISKLRADFARIHVEHSATDKAKEEFAQDLLSIAQGSGKPATNTLSRLANDLLTALAPTTVSTAADEKLVQKLVVLVNSGGLTETRDQELSEEAQTALQSAGVSATDASKIASDLESIATDVRTAAKI